LSKIEVNAIEPQCGTTLTLGASGDTVTLASGASQSGFGRAGAVDWQTGSIKTATFTAVNGQGFFCNTTSSAFTVNLPSSPSAGNIVAVSDYAKTFNTNNLTIGRGGSNIEGAASDLVLDASGLAMTFVYVDATKGWKVVGAGREADKTAAEFIEATGGTITTCGNFKVHTFTGPGTFTVCTVGNAAGSNTVDYLVVAGGAGGGGGNAGSSSVHGGGGGGAGGLRYAASTYSNPAPGPSAGTALPVSEQGYPISVGGGGAGKTGGGACTGCRGGSGVNSVFSTITSAGGGGGGTRNGAGSNNSGGPGGSGGGSTTGGGAGGTGNTPPVSPPQGNNGGSNSCQPVANMGGGGGSGAVGVNGSCSANGAGGAGLRVDINGSPTTYAGGGGGGSSATPQTLPTAGAGGAGGGGAGGNSPSDPGSNGTAGTTNTGGGGGGGGAKATGGNGGSGIVIIRYKFQ
jgi:hypothetical protein